MYMTFLSSTLDSNIRVYISPLCYYIVLKKCTTDFKSKNIYRQVVHTYKYKEGHDFRIVAKKVMHIPDPQPTSRQIHGLSF